MSGPKCYSYSVDWSAAQYSPPAEDPAVVAARVEAAALSAATGRIAAAAGRLEQLSHEVSQYRSQYGTSIAPLDVEVARSHKHSVAALKEAERVERLLLEREAQLRTQLGEARKGAFVSQLAGAGDAIPSGDRLSEVIAAGRGRKQKQDNVADSEKATAHIERCVSLFTRLRPDLSAETLAEVEQVLEAALASSSEERAALMIDRLRIAVSEANALAEARDHRLQQLDALCAELDAGEDLLSDDVVRLRDVLYEQRSGERTVEDLRAEMDAYRLAAQRERDAQLRERERAVVADALEEAFKELGYQVQDGFETALAADGSAFVRRSGWSDHAVRVLLDRGSEQMRFHVVRDDRTQLMSSDSVRREEEFCSDRVALEQVLARRGVALDAQELKPPGAVPVAVVSFEKTRLPRTRRAAVERRREKTKE